MAMTNRNNNKHDCFIFSTLEQLVPQDHEVRKLEAAVDWTFIYPAVKDLYSSVGRPGIDPVVLFKMIIINYTFGYNSMRRTCREIEVNVAYRWFLGLAMDEKVPDYSTWSQNYIRRYRDSDVFDCIFGYILDQAIEAGFIDPTTVYGDATHMKASANKRKSRKEEVELVRKVFENDLLEEINAVRREHHQKEINALSRTELDYDEETGEVIEHVKKKEIKVSETDPESGNYHKGEHEECFAYCHTVFCDGNGFVLGYGTVPGNIHDSVSFHDTYTKLNQKFGNTIQNVVLDAGYKTPAILREIIENDQTPYVPYKRPMTKKDFFPKYEYVYDEAKDIYICPAIKDLKYATTDRQGYRLYKSDPKDCSGCRYLSQCTNSRNHQKTVTRHVWADYTDQAEEIRHTDKWKEIYPRRKETIERVFADDKENHCLRFTRVRGLKKNGHQAALIFACHNLKRMAKWKWNRSISRSKKTAFSTKMIIDSYPHHFEMKKAVLSF